MRRVLERVAAERGRPEAILSDNGPEFQSRAVEAWALEAKVRRDFIEPGKPVQNAFIESFNGRFPPASKSFQNDAIRHDNVHIDGHVPTPGNRTTSSLLARGDEKQWGAPNEGAGRHPDGQGDHPDRRIVPVQPSRRAEEGDPGAQQAPGGPAVVEEFRKALRLIGIDATLAEAVETPADIQKFLDENSKDLDLKNLKTPIRNQLRGFRKNIGAGFGKLRATLDKADVPSHLEAEYTLLMDTERVTESTEDSAFPLVVWVAQNLDGEAAGAAYRILAAVTARRQFLKDQLGEKYILADNMENALKAIRRGGGTEWEGFAAWQPDPGRHMFTALTIPEHVFDRMRSKLAEVFEDSGMAGMFPAGEVAAMMDRIKEQRVVGGPKFEMVLPVELAATLDSFGSKDSDYYATVELYEKSIRAWKQWTLINPRRYFKYNLQNTSGDLDGVIAAFPKALKWKYLEPAFLELWDVTVRKGTPSAVFQEAAERGVLDGGWSISEVYDVQNDIEGLLVKPGLSQRTLRKIWKFLAKSTTFRENFLRYAMYLAVREEIQTARRENPGRLNEDLMPLVGYGAGRIDQVNAITSDADRAAYISRESLGDYGAISVLGQKA